MRADIRDLEVLYGDVNDKRVGVGLLWRDYLFFNTADVCRA